MSEPIKKDDVDEIDDNESDDDREHPDVSRWLDDEGDNTFQRMRPPPRRMGRSSRDD